MTLINTGSVSLSYDGDYVPSTTYQDGALYDPSTRTWQHLPPAPLGARSSTGLGGPRPTLPVFNVCWLRSMRRCLLRRSPE